MRISRGFYVGVYEVTQSEYRQVMDVNPSEFSADGEYSGVRGLDTSKYLGDTAGNVSEWVRDWYDQDAYQQYLDSTAVDPMGPADATDRVYRGGGWLNNGEDCSPPARYRLAPERRLNGLGFRVARGLPSE